MKNSSVTMKVMKSWTKITLRRSSYPHSICQRLYGSRLFTKHNYTQHALVMATITLNYQAFSFIYCPTVNKKFYLELESYLCHHERKSPRSIFIWKQSLSTLAVNFEAFTHLILDEPDALVVLFIYMLFFFSSIGWMLLRCIRSYTDTFCISETCMDSLYKLISVHKFCVCFLDGFMLSRVTLFSTCLQ